MIFMKLVFFSLFGFSSVAISISSGLSFSNVLNFFSFVSAGRYRVFINVSLSSAYFLPFPPIHLGLLDHKLGSGF